MVDGPYLDRDLAMHFLKSDERSIVLINPTMENFRNCFSKMEMIAAMDYLKSLSGKTNFFRLEMRYDKNITAHLPAFRQTGDMKTAHSANGSFLTEYEKLSDSFTSLGEVSSASGIIQVVSDKYSSGEPVYIGGFYTETDVLLFSAILFIGGFLPVIVSDMCSSSSERAHFSALETASRFSRIMDTRDIQRVQS